MLQAHPTKNGTGVSIFGDYGDLNSLYETVHYVADALYEYNKEQNGQHQLLMNFAYEIRKAYSGQRLTDEIQFDNNDQKINYYGFNIVWTDIILFINTLRYNNDFAQTNKLHQANIYMLEYIIETALSEYDKEAADNIKKHIPKGINIHNQYIFLLYQSMHIEYVTDKPGKLRFRNIPNLFKRHFSVGAKGYKNIMSSFEKIAKEENCEVIDLAFEEFPEIKW